MKKYIKPEIEIVRFDVKSVVMEATPTPMPQEYTRQGIASDVTDYIPTESVDQKIWTKVEDGGNWNWE